MKYGHIRGTDRRNNMQTALAELNSKSPEMTRMAPSQHRKDGKQEIMLEAIRAHLRFKLDTM
jgi:hypothetical protein